MRFALVVCAVLVCSVVRADEATEPKSVLAPTPAEPAPVVAPVEPAAPSVCYGPNCRLYNVEETTVETRRWRLFGGYVVRNNARTVYRPAARWRR